MDVEIVIFPETKVALIEHHGPPALEYETGKIRDGSIFL
jgi:AraC family transcriptional regulator